MACILLEQDPDHLSVDFLLLLPLTTHLNTENTLHLIYIHSYINKVINYYKSALPHF